MYGVKITIISNCCISGFALILIITGGYAAADIHLPPYFTGNIGGVQFHLTDPFGIFVVFMLIFELGRIALRKTKGTSLTYKDILFISFVVY